MRIKRISTLLLAGVLAIQSTFAAWGNTEVAFEDVEYTDEASVEESFIWETEEPDSPEDVFIDEIQEADREYGTEDYGYDSVAFDEPSSASDISEDIIEDDYASVPNEESEHIHQYEVTTEGNRAVVWCASDNCPDGLNYYASISSEDKVWDGEPARVELIVDMDMPYEVQVSDVFYKMQEEGMETTDDLMVPTSPGRYIAWAMIGDKPIFTEFTIENEIVVQEDSVSEDLMLADYSLDPNTEGMFTVVVAKKPSTVTAKDQTVVENDGIVTGIDQAVLADAVADHCLQDVTLEGDSTATPGIFPEGITPSNAEIVDAAGKNVTANYKINYVSGCLTVQKRIGYKVTFKVVNGSWDDETTTDKELTLTGVDGDSLKLSSDQIPLVGNKPGENYKAGSWDVEPSTETAITGDTVYTYTYVPNTQNVTAEGWSGVYDGSSHSITVTAEDGATITYAEEENGSYSETNPSYHDVGEHSVYYKVTKTGSIEVTGSQTVSITKRDLTITADSDSKTYDGTPLIKNSYTVNDAGLAAGEEIDSVTFSPSSTITNAGTQDNKISSAVIKKGETDTTGNYEITFVKGTLRVTKALTNNVTVSLEGWTIGDAGPHTPSCTADFGHETATFSYSSEENGTYTDSQPTTAGTWWVKATVPETNNYVGGEAKTSFEIKKPASSVTKAPEPISNLVYDGTEHDLVSAGTAEGGDMRYALSSSSGSAPEAKDYSDKLPVGTLPGDYYVWYMVEGDPDHENYTHPTPRSVSIAKATITGVNLTVDGKVFDGTDSVPYGSIHVNSLAGVRTVDSDSVRFEISSATFPDKNVGTDKTVTIRGTLNGSKALCYTLLSGTVTTTASITPKLISTNDTNLSITGTSVEYTGEAVVPATVTATYTFPENGIVTLTSGTDYDLSYSNNVNVGNEAEITATFKGNYSGTATAHFSITPVTASVTTAPSATNPTYDGTDQALVSGGVSAGGDFNYALGTDDKTAPGTGWGEEVPKGNNAGTYNVWYKVVGDDNHNSTEPYCVTVAISPKDITIKAKDQNIHVGDTVPSLNGDDFYTITGLVGTDALTTAPTLAYQQNNIAVFPDNTTTGTYDIVPSNANAGTNYSISYENGTLTIANKEVQTITAADVTATYGDTDKSVSGTANGQISYAVKAGSENYIDVDANTGALTIKAVPPIDGKAYVTVIAAETNTYAQATKDVTVTISKADPTANAPSGLTATYGQTLENVALTNPTNNTLGTWEWVSSSTDVGTVGDHTFKANFTPTDTNNYNSVSNVDVAVTVNKAANPTTVSNTATVIKGGDTVDLQANVAKNGAAGTVSYEISGEANGCSLNGSVLTSGGNTGSVTVNVSVAADDNYNALAAAAITVTITDKNTQTITAENITATYGDTDKSVSATANGTISYAVKTGSEDYIDVNASSGALTIKKVGTATVVVTAEETQTYAQATKDVTVTISKADPTANVPTDLTATYGQTLENVELTNLDGNTPGNWTWVNKSTSVGTVGDHTFPANFTPTDTTNYNSKSNVDVTVTVNRATNPATVSSTAAVMKGGNTVDLKDNVTKNGATGEVSYEISGENNGCSLNGSVLTSGDNTGSVTVNVTVATDNNYNALAATPITVTITDKYTQTITAADVTATFGDTDKRVSGTTSGDGQISYGVKAGSEDYIDVNTSTGALTIKAVPPTDGKAYVTVTAAETDTYAQAAKDVMVTISKANSSPATVTANNRTYDTTKQLLINVSGTPEGGDMEYALGSDGTTAPTAGWSASVPEETAAGIYYVWYKVVGDNNHNGTTAQHVRVTVGAKISNVKVNGVAEVENVAATGLDTYTERQSEDLVHVDLTVTPATNVNPIVAQIIADVYDGDVKVENLNIDITKSINDENPEPITDTIKVLGVAVQVKNLKNKHSITVLREHDRKVQRLKELSTMPTSEADYQDGTFYVDKSSGIIYIFTRYFSVYSIAYLPNVGHTVTFEKTSGAVDTVIVENGKTVTKPTDPVRGGYKFLGWYDSNQVYDFTTPVTGSLTLTAKWQSTGGGGYSTPSYRLSLQATDGASAAPTCNKNVSSSYSSGTRMTVTAADPVEGYKFVGWYSGSTLESGSKEYSFQLTDNKTLTATYAKLDAVTISATDVSVAVGEAYTPDKYTVLGLPEGVTAETVLDLKNLKLTTTYTTTANVGDTFAIVPSGATVISGDYSIEYRDGVLTVVKGEAVETFESDVEAGKVDQAKADYAKLNEKQKALSDVVAAKQKLDELEKEAEKKESDKEKADAVDKLIKALPATSTLSDKEKVKAAEDAYKALTDDQKALVAEKKKLDDAVKAIEKAEKDKQTADQGTADAVTKLIDQLPESVTPENKKSVNAVVKQYDALTDEQKALVPKEKRDKIEALKKAVSGEPVTEQFATAVDKIAGSKAGEGKALLDEATALLNSMTEDQKALIPESTMAAYEEAEKAFKKGRQFRSGDGYYKVLSNGDVTYLKPANKKAESAVVPNQVKKGKYFFKVIKISTKAFDGCEKMKWILIHKNVRVIGAYAFSGTGVLTKITVKGSGITAGKVVDAFGGAGKKKGEKLTVKVPSNKVSSYDGLFKGEGKLNKKAVVKAA